MASEAARQEAAIAALIVAGVPLADATRAVESAAAAEQRLPTDAEIAEDAAFVGTAADIESSRAAWWYLLSQESGWRKLTRILDATTWEPVT